MSDTKPIQSRRVKSWSAFKQDLALYIDRKWERRRTFMFRGQPCSKWGLQPTVDRIREFKDAKERETLLTELVNEFRREASGKVAVNIPDEDIETWEMLGRHHGLPTRLLDWTSSPYIAAYFAFDQLATVAHDERDDFVSIWVLRREEFLKADVDDLEVVEANWMNNPRAMVQRAIFTRLLSNDRFIERAIPSAMFRFDIPASEASLALSDLDEMNINPTSLQLDLDGAARAVSRRLLGEGRAGV